VPYTLQFFLFVSSVSQTLMWTAFWLIICPYVHQCVLCTSENQSLIFVGKGYKIQICKKSIQGTSPLGHLYSRDTSIQGTPILIREKCSHTGNLCYLYWSLDTFSGSRNPDSIQGHLSTEKAPLADKFKIKCALTMATTHELSNLNWYSALVGIQHTTSQRQVNHDFFIQSLSSCLKLWLQQIPR